MPKAATKIPVVWKTRKSVAHRLLGEAGVPLLDQLLAETQGVAKKRRWPLQEIKVDHYEDPEEDWEYMLLILDFDCPQPKALKLWTNYLNQIVSGMEEGLESDAKDIFTKKIYYDFESGS